LQTPAFSVWTLASVAPMHLQGVRMDAGPDRGSGLLGPISPELVLVDPCLPSRRGGCFRTSSSGRGRRRNPPPPVLVVEPAPVAPAEPPPPAIESAAPAPGRHWRRMLALAVLILVAGAMSGTLLGGRDSAPVGVFWRRRRSAEDPVPNASPQTTEPSKTAVRATRPSGTSTRRASTPRVRRNARGWSSTSSDRGAGRQLRRDALVAAPRAVQPSRRRPAARSAGLGAVVSRGRVASYRDSKVRPCTAYRYTIVNYDRRGRRSTGVPTTVLTGGCT
jgi:hypothetical protein